MFIPPIKIVDKNPANNVNARHNIFGITINRNIPRFASVLGQEIAEWWFLRSTSLLCYLVIVIPVLLFTSFTPGWVIPVLLLPTAFGLIPRIKFVRQQMELFGQSIEIAIAVDYYNADRDLLIKREAKILADYYHMFENWSYPKLEHELEQQVEKHMKWVKSNRKIIAYWDSLAKK